ncbi:DUF350 domain-containing protein [Streptomyces acidiscabies]|uniref:DUF350 domain-containing protein n=1 Tax=Streptomyces acidiscabies TaxID=42234 RepID=A0ABU4MC19_9ACTN|nr:DUF350 domain-containing protein [Streptomyces acidiscabies]MDX3025640.1 DUF350 domain-containing protein [Streptomyces acidiscabies]
MTEIFESTGQALLYGVVGLAVTAVGFLALDLVTPGKLYHVVWTERNRGAAVLLGSQSVAVGLVIMEAIEASESEQGLGHGLISTLLYGLAGVLVMTVVGIVIGVFTPGRMGEVVLDDKDGRPHPAAWVQAGMYLGTGFMVGAALS